MLYNGGLDHHNVTQPQEVEEAGRKMVHCGEGVLCREDHEYLLKFLLVGDSDVGKNEITDLLGPTVSIPPTPNLLFISDASPKTTTILLEGRRVRLQIWDTSGQGRFSTVLRSYSRGAQGILLVYDITNRWSFDGIRRWLTEIDEHAPGIPRILIGNRLHLEFNRAVSRFEAESFARKRGLPYFEISTLAYFNVHESLTELARLVIQRNGMRWLWKTSQVPSLQDLCCRAVLHCIKNVHAIEWLPLPAFLKFKVRSFAQGAEICMGSLPRRHGVHHTFSDVTPRQIARIVRPTFAVDRRLRSSNCSLM